jgi:hypothetical protein
MDFKEETNKSYKLHRQSHDQPRRTHNKSEHSWMKIERKIEEVFEEHHFPFRREKEIEMPLGC